jgi:hypothetical protein
MVGKTVRSIQELESTNLVKQWIFSDLKPKQVFTGWLKERKGIKGKWAGARWARPDLAQEQRRSAGGGI